MDNYIPFDQHISQSQSLSEIGNINSNSYSSTLKTYLTQLLLLFMMLLLAFNYIGVSYFISNGNSGFSFGFLRSLLSLSFIPFFYIDNSIQQGIENISGNHSYRIFGSLIQRSNLCALSIVVLSGVIRQMIIPISLMLTTVTNVGIIQPIVPVATTLMAVALRTEKLTYFTLFALVLCTLGLFVSERAWEKFQFDAGLFLLLTIPIAKGIQIASLQLLKNISSSEIHRLQIIGLGITVVPIFFLIELLAYCNGELGIFFHRLTQLKVLDLLAVLYSALAVILASWRIQIFAVKVVGSITVSMYQCFQPIFVFILAYVLLHEPIQICKVIGSLIICLGLIINQLGKLQIRASESIYITSNQVSPSCLRLLNNN